MTRNAEWEGLLTAKLVMLRDRLKDPGSAAATIRQAIMEADEEEARSREPAASDAQRSTDGRRTKRSVRGTAPSDGPKAPAKSAGAANGLTERVSRVFDDGEVHSMRDLATQLKVSPRQMKRAINRLVHDWKTIRHVGEERSGTYVRAGSQRSRAKR